jgi:hypothetical protein
MIFEKLISDLEKDKREQEAEIKEEGEKNQDTDYMDLHILQEENKVCPSKIENEEIFEDFNEYNHSNFLVGDRLEDKKEKQNNEVLSQFCCCKQGHEEQCPKWKPLLEFLILPLIPPRVVRKAFIGMMMEKF